MASTLALLLLVLCSLTATEAQLTVYNLRARNLGASGLSLPDGFVKVYCNTAYLDKTSTVKDNRNPNWSKEFSYSRARVNDVLKLEVYDGDLAFHDILGTCQGRLKAGTYSSFCSLSKGGTLYFTYRLG